VSDGSDGYFGDIAGGWRGNRASAEAALLGEPKKPWNQKLIAYGCFVYE